MTDSQLSQVRGRPRIMTDEETKMSMSRQPRIMTDEETKMSMSRQPRIMGSTPKIMTDDETKMSHEPKPLYEPYKLGFIRELPFPSDDPNKESVTITKYSSTIPVEITLHNTSEYHYNEFKLYNIAKKFILRDDKTKEIYKKIMNDQLEIINKKFSNNLAELEHRRNDETEKQQLKERIDKLQKDLDNYESKIKIKMNDPDYYSIERTDERNRDERGLEIMRERVNKETKYFQNLQHTLTTQLFSNTDQIKKGDYPDLLHMINKKKDDLFIQLMRWREGRLLPLFKNSLEKLVKKHREEEENNMTVELYNLFYKIYQQQLENYDSRSDDLKSLEYEYYQASSIDKSKQDYQRLKSLRKSIYEQKKYNDLTFEDRKIEYNEYIRRELATVNIRAILPFNPRDLVTMNGCPFHHKFIHEKLNKQSLAIYLKESENLQCKPSYIDYRNQGYKNKLIYDYLKQQGKGLKAPLPAKSISEREKLIQRLEFLELEIKDISTLDDPRYFYEIRDILNRLSSIGFLNESDKNERIKVIDELEDEWIHTKLPTLSTEKKEKNNIVDLVSNNNELNEIQLPVNIFNKSIIRETIKVPFRNIGKNIEVYFIKYAKNKIEGLCRNEGYIRKNSCKVITHTSGISNNDYIIYNVVFLCEVCIPYHNMQVECYVKNITKLGIRAVLTDNDNPMTIYISKEHHKFDLDNYPIEEGNKLTVTIVGYHFEKNDESISAFGILNEINLPKHNPIE
jgi:DNA-directed RNA polymerase subunit E'/Rpb7